MNEVNYSQINRLEQYNAYLKLIIHSLMTGKTIVVPKEHQKVNIIKIAEMHGASTLIKEPMTIEQYRKRQEIEK